MTVWVLSVDCFGTYDEPDLYVCISREAAEQRSLLIAQELWDSDYGHIDADKLDEDTPPRPETVEDVEDFASDTDWDFTVGEYEVLR
jgi:hypothetical protein